MKGTDLKLTPEIAAKLLGEEVEGAIRRIRAAGEELVTQLSAANTAVKPIDIAKAEIAAVIDFVQPYEFTGRSQLQLSFNGNSGGHVEVQAPRKGRYRALIMIERLGDAEGGQ